MKAAVNKQRIISFNKHVINYHVIKKSKNFSKSPTNCPTLRLHLPSHWERYAHHRYLANQAYPHVHLIILALLLASESTWDSISNAGS
jgi:hypothetical protein